MRRLVLFRHAKAARHAGGGDRERPLETRGQAGAARMGRWLAETGLTPDLALVSDARRTRETWQIAARELNHGIALRLEPRIYEAEADTLLGLIRKTDDSATTLLMVGHNPGFADLADSLAGRGDRDAMQRLRRKFPTSAVAVLSFDVDHWAETGWGGGTLEHFVTPAYLEGRGDDPD